MKLLIAFLIDKIGSFFAQLVGFFSKKAAVAALILAMSSMVIAFTAMMNGYIANVSSSPLTNAYILFGLGLLPSNASFCVALIAAAKATQWVFIWQMNLARTAFSGK